MTSRTLLFVTSTHPSNLSHRAHTVTSSIVMLSDGDLPEKQSSKSDPSSMTALRTERLVSNNSPVPNIPNNTARKKYPCARGIGRSCTVTTRSFWLPRPIIVSRCSFGSMTDAVIDCPPILSSSLLGSPCSTGPCSEFRLTLPLSSPFGESNSLSPMVPVLMWRRSLSLLATLTAATSSSPDNDDAVSSLPSTAVTGGEGGLPSSLGGLGDADPEQHTSSSSPLMRLTSFS
mmetsp:Transcript_21454/g.31104  ORF Transcript_21454/g.31104 Transcript_21454/m.31104 type:complete len:231 (+) Transcript_21454:4247-4939(+)